jgi:SAM-dependent methyltransferase
MLATEIGRQVRRGLQVVAHLGTRYTCPLCGYRSRSHKWIGVASSVLTGRRRAGCYNCGATDRERLVFTYLAEEFRLFTSRERRILHIAPEACLSSRIRKHNFQQYVCGDKFAPGYHYPSHVINLDVLQLPFADNSFDLVICNHVLEHIQDDRAAMRELLRVLSPGGQAILQVPFAKHEPKTYEDPTVTDPKRREQLFGQHDHVRLYGSDYGERLEAAGFTLRLAHLAHRFPRYALSLDEPLFVCAKTPEQEGVSWSAASSRSS